jgi:undecaprenyl-diphosphatase
MENTIILSIIQGITEFIPVSSTAHMILASKLFGIKGAGRMTEVSLHMGTLLVIMVYFRQDIIEFFQGLSKLFSGVITKGFNRCLMIAIATIPVVIAGYVVNTYFSTSFRALTIMGWTSIFFGMLLLFADKTSPTTKKYESMTYKDAIIIGLLQVLALIPGSSRLGTTIIAARLLGYDRVGSAKFSFLLSIPVVIGAMTLLVSQTFKVGGLQMSIDTLSSIVIAFVVGYLALMFIMRYLKKYSFFPIAIYRIVLGIYILSLS